MTDRLTTEARVRARVHLPLALREEASGSASIDVACTTVADAIDAACHAYPTLRRHILDERGTLRPHVNVFVNDADARTREGLSTTVRSGDAIHIVPSIAGG